MKTSALTKMIASAIPTAHQRGSHRSTVENSFSRLANWNNRAAISANYDRAASLRGRSERRARHPDRARGQGPRYL